MMKNRGKWQGLVIVFVAAIFSVSCSTNSQLSTAGAANLELNTATLDFGNVSVGNSKSKSLTLSNGSSENLSVTVSQVSVSGAGFSLKNVAAPFSLSPGQEAAITIVFAPKTGGAVQGTLSISVDSATEPVTASLGGSGVASNQLAVSPSNMNFGNVAVGDQKSLTGTLTAGSSNINISTADWSGTGYNLSGITFPVTVAAGKSISFTATFAPQSVGSASGGVSFVSNASNSPARVTFSGAGTQTQTGSGHSVDLSWQASSSSVIGYNIYRGTQSGGPYNRINATPQSGTSYVDNSVQSGATYYYVATAVSNNAVESNYSSEVTAAVPNP